MEHGLFARIRRALRGLGRRRVDARHTYTDAAVLEVYLWAALHDRPVCWACDARHWPPGTRRGALPSASTVSRRMRLDRVLTLLERVRARLDAPDQPGLVAIVDGKALAIGPHSHDDQSGYGRATGRKARGYKLYAVVSVGQKLLAWRIAPMHVDERTMARRMLKQLPPLAYLLGDSNYDANRLFDACLEHDIELRAPRRYGVRRGLGRHRHSPARLRSKDSLEVAPSGFGRDLMKNRWAVERFFGDLCGAPGGLGHLPAWVRSWRRVRTWVAAKLAIQAARRGARWEALMQ